MPSSKTFRQIDKKCLQCNKRLVLGNNRDIERKVFCSRACSNRFSLYKRNKELKNKFCPICTKEFKPTNTSQKNCSSICTASQQVERSYKYLNDNPPAYIAHLLCKAWRKHIPLEYILDLYEKQKGLCALSGIRMTFIKKTDGNKIHTNLSIDRIDSSIGYEIGNIQLVCAIVNVMKSTLLKPELQWWCSKIVGGGL